MRWVRIGFVDAMTHAVSSPLVAPLVAEMRGRGSAIQDYEVAYGREYARALGGNPAPITAWAFDVGGPCCVHMPVEVIAVDGLDIEIPCDQFEAIHRAADRFGIRRFATGEWYYKFKFWLHATVLTVEQRDTVLFALEDRLAVAKQRARAFRDAEMRAGEGAN